MRYKHLSLAERQYIQFELKMGENFSEIASSLGRSASTISREVHRNTGLRGYRYQQADRKAMDIISLHHETIYQYILDDKRQGGQLYNYLRHQNKTYRKRCGTVHNRTGIPNRKDIDQRPAEANNRSETGHWEADTIIGNQHKGAIVTLDERKTRLRLAAPLKRKKLPVLPKLLKFFWLL